MSGIGDAFNLGLTALGGGELMAIGRGGVNGVNNARNYLTSVKPAKPIITADNAALMSDAQWDVAYNNAVKANDMAEVQRLRDLHFKTKAPNTKVVDKNGEPLHTYHGTKSEFNYFDENKYGATDGGTYGTGVYTTPYKEYAETYGDNVLDLYNNINFPVDARKYEVDDLMKAKLREGKDLFRWTDIGGRRDGVFGRNFYLKTEYPYEIVSHKPNNVKLANSITYDDAGNIIPLSQRDNFAVNDLRYAFKPNSSMAVEPNFFSFFDDVAINKTKLPSYAQNPSKENLTKAPEILDERFNYRDWIERMEGRKVTDKEYEQLRKQYPTNQKIFRDREWDDSRAINNEIHIGKQGIHEPEIENTILAHEKDHAYGIPKLSDKEIENIFGYNWDSYLRGDNGAEMFARLGQVANWYGIRDIAKQPLTGDMIKYAASKGNFIKDANFDNNMTDFFSILKANNSWDAAARAFNKYGKALVPLALIYPLYKSNMNNETN